MNSSFYEKRYEKINRESAKLFNLKLIITCVFCLIALTLYLLNYVHFPVLCLIFLGALWNFFIDINTFLAFSLSLFVGLIFAMLAVIDGLYANAMLYLFFYIPLQFVVWIINPKETDMSIKKDKRLSKDMIYYICVAFILAFALIGAAALTIANETLIFFDIFSACMLGLSAFLQSYMYREFYPVRIISVLISIALWIKVFTVQVYSMGAIGIVLLYLMYLIVDVCSYISWMKASIPFDKDSVEELDEKARKKLVQEKVEEYNKLLNEVRVQNNDDDKGVNA